MEDGQGDRERKGDMGKEELEKRNGAEQGGEEWHWPRTSALMTAGTEEVPGSACSSD